MISKKQGQMQLSVGMVVIIVLSVLALVLGVYLTQQIFSGATSSVESIDQALKNEINKLFAEDDSRKLIVFPPTRQITIKKGNEDNPGFAFSIRNVEITEGKFTYEVFANDPDLRDRCNLNEAEVESWIQVGRTGSITIPPGSSMADPEHVRFFIPESAPPCTVRYGIEVEKDRVQYGTTINVDLKVKSS
tara:strand:- start:1516 stop:2085 length:570 start_codon:yes stop_codon:yes gene_type:complete